MARIRYADAAVTPSDIASALRKLPPLNVFGLMAASPGTFMPWLGLGNALVHDLALAPSLRELVICQIGRLTHPYAWEQHVPLARHFGITQEQIAALERDDGRTQFDATQRAVLAFTVSFVRDGRVSDQDYAELAALLPDRQIVEIAVVAGQYVGLTRMMTALGIDSDPVVGPGGLGATERVLQGAPITTV